MAQRVAQRGTKAALVEAFLLPVFTHRESERPMDWNSEHSRRRFMAFGIAGAVPFIAGGRRLLAQRAAIGSARPPRDPVIDQIASEMVRIHKSAKARGIRAEHVHGFAGQTRVFLAHARATGLDARVRGAVGDSIDARGRDGLLDTDADDRVNAQLKAMGIDPSDRPPRARLERPRRAEVLDSILVGGLTPHLERLDAALARAEKSAEKLGDRAIAGPTGLLAQDCWTSWSLLIDELTWMAEIFSMMGMPELGGIFGLCAMLCGMSMYVCCWGG